MTIEVITRDEVIKRLTSVGITPSPVVFALLDNGYSIEDLLFVTKYDFFGILVQYPETREEKRYELFLRRVEV